MLGLGVEDWTAIGAMAAVLGLLLSLWIAWRHRPSTRASTSQSSAAPEGTNEGAERDLAQWPPDAHFEGPQDRPELQRLWSGDELLRLVRAGDRYQAANDEPRDEDEAEQLADAQSAIFSWVEASDAIEDPGEWVRAGFELTGLIQELANGGWGIYGAVVTNTLVVGSRSAPWRTVVVSIKRMPEARSAA